MSNINIVKVRYKEDVKQDYVDYKINDVDSAVSFVKTLFPSHSDEEMFLLNLNSLNRVINVFNGSEQYLLNNFQKLLANSVLSNTAYSILYSRGNDRNKESKKEFALKIGRGLYNLGIRLLDYICETDYDCISYTRLNEFNLKDFYVDKNIIHTFDRDYLSDVKDLSYLQIEKEENFASSTIKETVNYIANKMKYMDRECCCIISIDNKGKPLNATIASIGSINETFAFGRELFKVPLLSGAKEIIMMHNHPSGSVKPSQTAELLIYKVMDTAYSLGIEVRDNIIVGGLTGEIYSMLFNQHEGFLNVIEGRQKEKENYSKKESLLEKSKDVEKQITFDFERK